MRAWSAVLTAGAAPEVVVSAVACIPIMSVIGIYWAVGSK